MANSATKHLPRNLQSQNRPLGLKETESVPGLKMASEDVLVPFVVGQQYVSAHPAVLHTVKKTWCYKWSGDFDITDGNESIIYKGHRSGTNKKFVLTSQIDGTVLSIYKHKKFSGSQRWKAYRGEEPNEDQLLFETRRKHSIIGFYLPSNADKEQPDFTIKKASGWFNFGAELFYGQQRIAKTTKEGFKFGRRKNFISVVGNIDQAFIAAVLVLLEAEIEEQQKSGFEVSVSVTV